MHDLSFLICGMWIMEIGHFSFYICFSSRLYHLLSCRVISIMGLGPGDVARVGPHCGPHFFIGGFFPIPFIKRRFGPAPLGSCSGPMSFSTPSNGNKLIPHISCFSRRRGNILNWGKRDNVTFMDESTLKIFYNICFSNSLNLKM